MVSDKKIFQAFYIRKISSDPWNPCFFDKSQWLEQSWWSVTKVTFLMNYIEIGTMVSDKKILSHAHLLVAMFLFLFFFFDKS